jgi:hypothetical protein
MTLEEFMQQQATQRGYTKSPLKYVFEGFDGGQEEIDQNRVDFQQILPSLKRIDPVYGEMEDYQVGEADAPSYAQRFASREEELKNAYYADPSNFIETRATPYNQGINTFNEGNEDQKKILDQINTGQLRIVPVTYTSEFFNSDASAVQKQTHSGYELKDARTGQKIQDVTPIDAEKGIFNIVADDRNSSGFFNNYVSTDPKGFVNPIVSEQQSQYQSKPNSSANFIKSSLLGALQMGAMFMTAGASTAIGSAILGTGATGAATLGGAIVGAGMNVLTSAATGNDITAGGVLTGAATGAIGANATDIASNIVGVGDAVAGLDTLKMIASETGIKLADVSKIVSGAVANGIGSAVAGKDIVESVTKNLVSSGLGAYAGGLVNSIDPGNLDNAVKAASGVARLGVATAMNGGDITTALQNNLPSIVMNSISLPKDGSANDIQKAEIDALDPMGQYLANYLANPDTPDPLGPDIYSTAANVSLMNSTEPTLDVQGRTSVPKIDNGYKFNEDTSTYTSPTGEELSYEQYYARTTPGELDPTLVDVAPEPINNQPTSPLSPDPRQLDEAFEYYDNLVAQGIEPALASKMSGYTPAGTGVLPSDGTGTTTGTPDGTGTAPLTSPLSTAPIAPTNPDLTAGELVVEGERPYTPFEEDFPLQPDEEPTVIKPPTGTVGLPKVTIPSTTPKTPTVVPKTTGALPTAITTATDSSFSMPSAGAQTTPAVTAPLSISATSLAGAPVYNNNPQLLAELKQMYPQLSTLNPKLLNMLGASPKGTPPLSQSAQVAQAQNQNDLMTNFMGKGISTDLDLPSFADGGHIHGMEYGQSPKFITGATGHYVKGAGDGQSDDIPALLADGEYVFDADTVAQLGNGSSDAGAKFLDHFRQAVREHKRSAPVDKIPPKASPLAYMKEALKRHSKG